MTFTLLHGDCLDRLRELPDSSIDACVTDPPYGLSFMGKRWDYDVPSVEVWAECLRVLKPGGHLLAFAGTRTQHRMAVRIEDAGFEIRDMIAWVYGNGFPKSLDVSKAIDKAAGAEREVVGVAADFSLDGAKRKTDGSHAKPTNQVPNGDRWSQPITAPATDAARQWSGWGTALKPALEPITLARKPFPGTVAANVLEHGTGAINVDGCRVEGGERPLLERSHQYRPENVDLPSGSRAAGATTQGRWPANLLHDGSDGVVGLFPQAKGQQGAVSGKEPSSKTANVFGDFAGRAPSQPRNDSGSAARFFYCAKTSKAERGPDNNHPTVKPIKLMAYLCRLVTPPGGIVLDPFMGSGSTGKAAVREGFRFIGIEREVEYLAIAQQRIEQAVDPQSSLPLLLNHSQ